jgi:hypothetical protein
VNHCSLRTAVHTIPAITSTCYTDTCILKYSYFLTDRIVYHVCCVQLKSSLLQVCTIIGSNVLALLMSKLDMSMYDMALMAHMLASTAIVVSAVSQSLVAMFFAFLTFEVSFRMQFIQCHTSEPLLSECLPQMLQLCLHIVSSKLSCCSCVSFFCYALDR